MIDPEVHTGDPPRVKGEIYNLYVLVDKDKDTVEGCIKHFVGKFGRNPASVYLSGKRVWIGPVEKREI